MADKKEPSQAQKFFIQHGEKVALGVAAALLVGYLVYSFLFTSENADALRLRGMTATTETEKTKEHADLAPQKGAGLQSTALAPYTSTSQADAANPWATSYPTTGNVTVKEIDLEKETATMLASVTMVSKADVAIDGITIKFNAGTVDTDTGPRLQANWTWAASTLNETQVKRLSRLWFDALTGIASHVKSGGGGLTPSDITARVSQQQLDELQRQYADR